MADIVDKATRSRMMASIKGKSTKPEVLIRTELHRRGFRYRLHSALMPGKPDIVLPKYRSLIIVNGCFWHGHDCHLFKWPETRAEFWRKKIEANSERDARNQQQYVELRWRYLVIWECALKGSGKLPLNELADKIEGWIRSGSGNKEFSGKL